MMMQPNVEKKCPEYRLRLFLSADLAGSTAYKTAAKQKENDIYPEWVTTITKGFYYTFPNIFSDEYKINCNSETILHEYAPKLWKKIGDELVFCIKICSEEHLKICVCAFKEAIAKYRKVLSEKNLKLDIKGAIWIGAFPFPNLSLSKEFSNDMYGDEETENEIDKKPDEYDFLGPSIDAGFRVAKFSTPAKMFLSLEVSYLLLNIANDYNKKNKQCDFLIGYHGKEIMKGVIDERPYPLFFIHTETNEEEVELSTKENKVLKRDDKINHDEALEFLKLFLKKEKIATPDLHGENVENYQNFCRKWRSEYNNTQENKSIIPNIEEKSNSNLENKYRNIIDNYFFSFSESK